jgi:hypothetical protein
MAFLRKILLVFARNWIITVVFEKNAKFNAEMSITLAPAGLMFLPNGFSQMC